MEICDTRNTHVISYLITRNSNKKKRLLWRECHSGSMELFEFLFMSGCLSGCAMLENGILTLAHDNRIWPVLAKNIFICFKCNRKYMNIYNVARGGCSKEDLVNPALVRDYWTNILRICLRNLEFVFTDLILINRGFILSSLKWKCQEIRKWITD